MGGAVGWRYMTMVTLLRPPARELASGEEVLLLAVSSDTTLRDMTDAFLSGCDGTDQQPAATTPTATAMASPSPTAGGGVRAPETAGSTRPASTPTPEPHGRDGPATTTPVPTTPVPATPTSCPLPTPVRGLRPGRYHRGPHSGRQRRRTSRAALTPTRVPCRPAPTGSAPLNEGRPPPHRAGPCPTPGRTASTPGASTSRPTSSCRTPPTTPRGHRRQGRSTENIVQRAARHDEQDALPVFRT